MYLTSSIKLTSPFYAQYRGQILYSPNLWLITQLTECTYTIHNSRTIRTCTSYIIRQLPGHSAHFIHRIKNKLGSDLKASCGDWKPLFSQSVLWLIRRIYFRWKYVCIIHLCWFRWLLLYSICLLLQWCFTLLSVKMYVWIIIIMIIFEN